MKWFAIYNQRKSDFNNNTFVKDYFQLRLNLVKVVMKLNFITRKKLRILIK